jgi:hypothetical protein
MKNHAVFDPAGSEKSKQSHKTERSQKCDPEANIQRENIRDAGSFLESRAPAHLNPIRSVFLLTAKLPLESIDDTFDAGLEDIGGHAHSSPSFSAVAENSQDPNQSRRALIVLIWRCAVQQAHVEFFEANLRELRVMSFENLSHGVVDRMNRPAAVGGNEILFSEDFNQYGRFRRRRQAG